MDPSSDLKTPVNTPEAEAIDVVCICGGYGFPIGTASASRITMVGRTLQQAGFRFRLIHCGPSPVRINTARTGIHEGIEFEYTTQVKRPENGLLRSLTYALGFFRLARRLVRLRFKRRRTLVYLYAMDGILNLLAARICRILNLPVVQELCEWPPGEPQCPWLTRWLYRSTIFAQATGVLVISKGIEQRVRTIGARTNPDLLVHRLPALFDFRQYSMVMPPENRADSTPVFAYCGTWMRDVYFLVQTIARIKQQKGSGILMLIGAYEPSTRREIMDLAASHGLMPGDVKFSGHVDEPTLHEIYRNAFALLMPLPDDDRSITRLPNKMSEYLSSGRPVITCDIGDLREILVDGVNAYLAKPGDVESFAEKMLDAVKDPATADRIGAAGRAAGIKYLDFRSHAIPLGEFFTDCCNWHEELRMRAKESTLLKQGQKAIRNTLFLAAALAFLATGCVYRAQKRIFRNGLVTALYFHNPNRRLFRQCLQWLKSHGYSFISANDLIQFLYNRKSLPRGSVWISFDDGYKELLERVLPLAHGQEIPLTLFLPSAIVKGNGILPWIKHVKCKWSDSGRFVDSLAVRDAIGVAELDQLARLPEVTMGSHTAFHLRINELSEERLTSELVDSKQTLEFYARASVPCFSYPESRYSGSEKRSLMRAGYLLAATDENAFITQGTDPFYVPRLCIPDQITYAEAICRMVGIWCPAIEPVKNLVLRYAGRSRRRIAVPAADSSLR